MEWMNRGGEGEGDNMSTDIKPTMEELKDVSRRQANRALGYLSALEDLHLERGQIIERLLSRAKREREDVTGCRPGFLPYSEGIFAAQELEALAESVRKDL